MLSEFAEKKETCFDYKKQNFSKSKKCAFSKRLTHAFGRKSLFFPYLDFIKKRLKIMLFAFAEKKDTFLTFENRIFQSPRNRTFSKGIIHAFGQKMPIFWFI